MTGTRKNRIRACCIAVLLTASALGCAPKEAPPAATVSVPVPTPTATVAVVSEQVELSVPQTPVPTPVPTPEPTATPVPLPLAGVSVGIDPGHQQHADSGQEPIAPGTSKTKSKISGSARGVRSGMMEYAVNLEVALRLQTLLVENGATVVMTRIINDVRISNKERAELMNEANVDLVLRLHCNGNADHDKHGAYMLVPSEKRTDTYDYNRRAAQCIIDAYCIVTGIDHPKNDVIDRSDQTGFNWSTRPVVTIEMGFLTNPGDDALLSKEAFWDTMAQGLYEGIVAFFVAEGMATELPPDVTPEATPDVTSEATPDVTPEGSTEPVPDAAAETPAP